MCVCAATFACTILLSLHSEDLGLHVKFVLSVFNLIDRGNLKTVSFDWRAQESERDRKYCMVKPTASSLNAQHYDDEIINILGLVLCFRHAIQIMCE